MTNKTKRAFEHLLNSRRPGGVCNPRYQTILHAAITSTPVSQALEEAIEHFSVNYEDAKAAVARLDLE